MSVELVQRKFLITVFILVSLIDRGSHGVATHFLGVFVFRESLRRPNGVSKRPMQYTINFFITV
jgi:hypothetical protein